MNHGTCKKNIAVWGLIECGKPAKYKCTSPISHAAILTCGVHKRRFARLGWIITDLEREAKMEAESK